MSLVFLPLTIALGICLATIWLLPRANLQGAGGYFIASRPTPPDVIRNCFVAYPLRIVTFGAFFGWGASGGLWPAIFGAASFGLGMYLIYTLRHPLLAFLDHALDGNTSMTVSGFIADRHGNDARVRLLTACLTLAALTGLITAEAFATATLVAPVQMESATAVYSLAGGMVALTVLCTIFAGNSGVMHSVQLQVGMIYLALFGSTALLLYFLVSDVTAMPPHGSFAVIFIFAACIFILFNRRSKYVDKTPIGGTNGMNAGDAGRLSSVSRLLRRLANILDTFISVLVILVIVLIVMELSAFGVPIMARDSVAALHMGTGISGTMLLTIVGVPLLYPIVDVATWQKLAALAKDTGAEPNLRSSTITRIFNSLSAEVTLLLLLMCMFGAIAVVATETPADHNALQSFIGQLALDESQPAVLAVSFLFLGVFAIALSAMSSMFSASLLVLRYDLLPALWPSLRSDWITTGDEATARRRTILMACGLCLAAILLVDVANSYFGMVLTSSTFLAVSIACWCAQLSSVTLVLAPLGLGSRGAVGAHWALLIVGVAAASGIAAVIVYVASGAEPWLWAAVPACLGSGLVLFVIAWFRRTGRPQGDELTE